MENELKNLKEAAQSANWSIDWHINKLAKEQDLLPAINERIAHLEAVLIKNK